MVSLRLIVSQMLKYIGSKGTLSALAEVSGGAGSHIQADDLYVPGELRVMHFDKSVRLLVCVHNTGAATLANELCAHARQLQPRVDYQVVTELGQSRRTELSVLRSRLKLASPRKLSRQDGDGATQRSSADDASRGGRAEVACPLMPL